MLDEYLIAVATWMVDDISDNTEIVMAEASKNARETAENGLA